MIVIICGSRGYGGDEHMETLREAIRLSGFRITTVFHGANEDTPDRLGRIWGESRGIRVRGFKMESKADLTKRNIPLAAAGPRRNTRMKKAGGEAVIALWDGKTPGTKDMVNKMKKKHPVFVYRVDGEPHEVYPKQTTLGF